jgi:sulfite exporter TauE/SafE
MQTSMALTALLMGLVGGPHCVAMCGAACTGISAAAAPHSQRALWVFQLARIAAYSAMGALAAGSVQAFAWLGSQTSVVRPVWTLFHVVVFFMGAALLWQARQPAWVDRVGQSVWRKTRPWIARHKQRAPAVLGAAWALMPCGLLYSALLLASLSANAVEGAGVMALFALGTTASLALGPWLFLRLRASSNGAWGMRLAGLALVLTSAWALWMGITQPSGIWCL